MAIQTKIDGMYRLLELQMVFIDLTENRDGLFPLTSEG